MSIRPLRSEMITKLAKKLGMVVQKFPISISFPRIRFNYTKKEDVLTVRRRLHIIVSRDHRGVC